MGKKTTQAKKLANVLNAHRCCDVNVDQETQQQVEIDFTEERTQDLLTTVCAELVNLPRNDSILSINFGHVTVNAGSDSDHHWGLCSISSSLCEWKLDFKHSLQPDVTKVQAPFRIKKCKHPLTYPQQASWLSNNYSFQIDDIDQAAQALAYTNYYRLRGYYVHWETDSSHIIDFNEVLRLHEFDHKLRHLLLPYLLSIEIKIRTKIAYYHAHRYGGLGYLCKEHFENEAYHADFLTEISKLRSRSDELFIAHFATNYAGQIPIWALVETLSFGTLSKFFDNMSREDRKRIARIDFELNEENLGSYLQSLSILRNICAHNGRLYNRRIPVSIRVSSESTRLLSAHLPTNFKCEATSLFSFVIGIIELLDTCQTEEFSKSLSALTKEFSDVIEVQLLGFPADWNLLLLMELK